MRIAAILLLLTMLNSCGAEVELTKPIRLLGDWHAVQLDGKPLIGAKPLHLYLDGTSVDAFLGCNHATGSITLDQIQQTINFSNTLMTEMFCPDQNLREQEISYFEALGTIRSYTLIKETLTLFDEHKQPRLVYKKPHPELAGMWQVTRLNGHPPMIKDWYNPLSLWFDSRYVGGFSSCNNFGSQVNIFNNTIALADMESTAQACEPDVMAQETAYHQALQAVRTFVLDGDRLTLFDDQQIAVVELTRPTTLLDGTWKLSTINGYGVQTSAPPTLIIMGNRIAGFAGCNHFEAPFTPNFSDNTLSVGSLTATSMACADQTIMQREATYREYLQNTIRFGYSGYTLRLYDDQGNHLSFEKH